MADVKLQGVAKAYGATKILHGIDLDIRDGEFMVFVGPSGCGKSTLLRVIAGLEDITGGTLAIGGKVVNDVPPAERGIAMVFQSYALYPHMNLFDDMAFGLKLAKLPKDRDLNLADLATIPKEFYSIQEVKLEEQEPLAREIQSFLEAVEHGHEPVVPGEHGVRAMQAAETILKEMRAHRWK